MIPVRPIPSSRLAGLALAVVGATTAAAQSLSHVVLPVGTAASDALGSNTLPWSRAAIGPAHVQFVYDSAQLTNQGVNQPIAIHRLRWRADGIGTSWTGGVYLNVVVGLGTSATDSSLPSATFANNRGPDYTIVHNGPVAFLPGTATAGAVGPTVIDLALATPFAYDPSLGQDLLIDITLPSGQWVGGTTIPTDALATSFGCSRVSSTNVTSPTGTRTLNAQALVVDLGYRTSNGLYADFSANVQHGPSPLAVQFSDLSVTSDPAGIASWAWDFDGDGLTDSTQRNPSFTYTNCGSYTVSLRVTDTLHGANTYTVPDFIVTDEITPSFSVTQLTPDTFLFQDTSAPAGTNWTWDLDGDSVVDASGPTALFTYPSSCVGATVTLSVSRNCRGPFTVTQNLHVSPGQLATTTVGGTVTTGNNIEWPGIFFDITVTNPLGISICGVSLPLRATSGTLDFDFDVTPGSYVGKDLDPTQWHWATTAYGPVLGTPTSNVTLSPITLSHPVYLAPGSYGISIWCNDFFGQTDLISSTGPAGPFANADLTIASTPGLVRSDWFSGTAVANQAFNGILHYSPVGAIGEAGMGFFGGGCLSSAGSMVDMNCTSLPRLGGTMTMDLFNLPADAAFMAIGFSRTTSVLGPLPLDLAFVGAPGCFDRVSLDLTSFAFGSGGYAQWSVAVPSTPAYLGAQFYVQNFPYDPIANTFGFVAGKAFAGIVGN